MAGLVFGAGPAKMVSLPKAASGSGMGLKFVLVSHGSSGDPFHSVVQQGMEDAALVYGVKAEILFSEGDNAKEVDIMEQAIAGNPDGIGVSIVDPVALDKGIPMIAFHNDDSNTPNARLAYIGASEKKVGYVLGKFMQQFLKKGDTIVIPEEVPGMSYAVNRSAGYERAETTRRISAYMMGHKEVKAIVNVGGLTTEIAGMVVQDLKLQGKVVVGGLAAFAGAIQVFRMGSAYSNAGQSMELSAIAATAHILIQGRKRNG
ncbi:MAG: substrate-binding domain-containing protein [Spirochaetes bacterium]|nr:substrate-binding domain-containing protein [Spirochaetota bacterium]